MRGFSLVTLELPISQAKRTFVGKRNANRFYSEKGVKGLYKNLLYMILPKGLR
jgi:hypothetical protein